MEIVSLITHFTLFVAFTWGAQTEYHNAGLAPYRLQNDINYHYYSRNPQTMPIVSSAMPMQIIPRPDYRRFVGSHQKSDSNIEHQSLIKGTLPGCLDQVYKIGTVITTGLNGNAHLLIFLLQFALSQLGIHNNNVYLLQLFWLLSLTAFVMHGQMPGRGFFGMLSLVVNGIVFLTIGFGVPSPQIARVVCTCLALASLSLGHQNDTDFHRIIMLSASLTAYDQHWMFGLFMIVWAIVRTFVLKYLE